jgi:hypothetical protein
MKNFLKPILFLLIAASVVGIMYYMSITENGGDPPPPPPKPQSYAQLQEKCNSIGQNLWNKTDYADIKGKIETFSSGSNKTIDASQANILKTSLELQYAQSMVKSFDYWKENKGINSIDEVFNVMKTQSSVSGCNEVLKRPLEVIANYKMALTIPSRVNAFLSSNYSEPVYVNLNKMLDDYIVNTPELNGFQTIDSINNNSITNLTAFKQIATKFNQNFNWPKNNDEEWRQYMYPFCPGKTNSVEKYPAYKYRLDSLNSVYQNSICD